MTANRRWTMQFLVNRLRRGGVAFVALCCLSIATSGDARERWPVTGKIIGKNEKKAKDVSGIACLTTSGFPRTCMVVDDNVQHAQLVTLYDGELVANEVVPLNDSSFEGKALELDGEGVAYAGGHFYVIGSHGRPRDKDGKLKESEKRDLLNAQITASSQLIKIWLNAAGATVVDRTARLRDVLRQQRDLAPFVDRRLEKNGLTVEGVAIIRDRLFAGLRAPILSGDQAAIVSVELNALFGSGEPKEKLHFLKLGKGRGVRDLAAFRDGILIVAGPSADEKGQYAIYWWNGHDDAATMLAELTEATGKKGKRKVEGLLPLDQSADRLRILLLFDGEKEGAPVALQIPAPSAEARR